MKKLLALALLSAACATAPDRGAASVSAPGDVDPRTKGQTASAQQTPAPDVDRAQKPSALDRPIAFQAPVPQELKLKNGARLFVVENPKLPLVSVTLFVEAGVDVEPEKQSGIAGFMTGTLDEGTKTRSAEKIAEELEDLAAHLSASDDDTGMAVSLNCLTEVLPQALDIFTDVSLNPAFRKADVERVRNLILTDLAQKKANPGMLACDAMRAALYGQKHPWGRPAGGTDKTIKAITPVDLKKFHDTWFVPNESFFMVVGDVKADAVRALLDERFAQWKPKPVRRPALPPFPAENARKVVLVDKPGATQSQVWVGGRLPLKASSPDAEALRIANTSLGGLFSSRLNMNLREQKGFSYGVFSSVSLSREVGQLVARGSIISQHTAPALDEYQKELARFATGDISEDEFKRAKEAYLRSLPARMETNDAVSALLVDAVHDRLPLDYYAKVPQRMQALTIADAQAAAKRYVTPGAWPVVVVGPRAQFQDAVDALKLGKVVGAAAMGSQAPRGAKASKPSRASP